MSYRNAKILPLGDFISFFIKKIIHFIGLTDISHYSFAILMEMWSSLNESGIANLYCSFKTSKEKLQLPLGTGTVWGSRHANHQPRWP